MKRSDFLPLHNIFQESMKRVDRRHREMDCMRMTDGLKEGVLIGLKEGMLDEWRLYVRSPDRSGVTRSNKSNVESYFRHQHHFKFNFYLFCLIVLRRQSKFSESLWLYAELAMLHLYLSETSTWICKCLFILFLQDFSIFCLIFKNNLINETNHIIILYCCIIIKLNRLNRTIDVHFRCRHFCFATVSKTTIIYRILPTGLTSALDFCWKKNFSTEIWKMRRLSTAVCNYFTII